MEKPQKHEKQDQFSASAKRDQLSHTKTEN